MAVLLALLTACVYGTGDYLGGRATRHVPVAVVTFVGQLFGLLVLLAVTVVSGTRVPGIHDWLWGGAAGLVGSTGLLAFYRAMSGGHMTVAAPIAAIMNAIIPVGVGLFQGERPGVLALVGIPLALVSIALVSDVLGPGHHRAPARTVLLAALGGSMFGLILVFLHQTNDSSGVWPVLIMRFVSAPWMAFVLLGSRQKVSAVRGHRGVVIGSGVLDSLANWFYVLAVREGLLSVVSVIVTLYPASTMMLAVGIDKERVHRSQLAGMVMAAGALSLIALS